MRRITTLLVALLGVVLATSAQSKIEHLTLKSKLLGVEKNYSVYLPDGYDKSGEQYPVLYLLHGAWGTNLSWVRAKGERGGNLQAIADAPRVLQSDCRPDAVFCVNDDCAAGVLHAAKSLGMKVPEDLSICGFSDAPICSITTPMLTTVEQRGAEIGRRAMLALLRRLKGDDASPHTDMVSANLIVRDTTK